MSSPIHPFITGFCFGCFYAWASVLALTSGVTVAPKYPLRMQLTSQTWKPISPTLNPPTHDMNETHEPHPPTPNMAPNKENPLVLTWSAAPYYPVSSCYQTVIHQNKVLTWKRTTASGDAALHAYEALKGGCWLDMRLTVCYCGSCFQMLK